VTDALVSVEATGETVGEAKWRALRELELLVPSLDKASVRFQVLSEGERGLLGVGYTPARVVATAAEGEIAVAPVARDESGPAAKLRDLLARRPPRADRDQDVVDEDEVPPQFPDTTGVLIGRHGQMTDASSTREHACAPCGRR
jgi:predicted RNA-binding protein Jag